MVGDGDSSGGKISIFPLVIPRSTLRIKARNRYRFEEEKETKRLGPILWPEVAGPARNRPEKGHGYSTEKRGIGPRRERENISRNGNFHFGTFLKYKQPEIVTQLPLTITSAYELRLIRTSCPRTRFHAFYNFHEQNIFKFLTEQKVNLRAPQKP